MMKRFIYLPIFLTLLVGLSSCQQDDFFLDDDEVERTDNLPIQLDAFIGDAVDTRSVDKAKKTFSFGDVESGVSADVIHVQSTFTLDDGSTLTRYCAMQYTEDEKWMPMGNASFAWPNNAVTGTFTAYYIYGSNGELTTNVGENAVTQTRFTDIIDGQDPLRACTEDVRYGHTVGLKFQHILTHLTLIELDAGIDDQLIFRIDPGNNQKLNNAFQILLVEDDNKEPHIEFNYISIPEILKEDPVAGNVYGTLIKSPTELVRDKQTRAESCQVGFFLQPDCSYNAFSIYYSNGDRYLTYKNSDPNTQNRKLDGNNRYIFNVKKSAGVTITTPPEQKWDESEEFTTVVDTEKFLQAVYTNSSYSEYSEEKQEMVQILEATNNPAGTLLKCNIRFQNPYYHIFPHPASTDDDGNPVAAYDFVPLVGSDNVFDGGYHYIKDLCCPLFFENSGVIKNLGFVNTTIGVDPQYEWTSILNYSEPGAVKTYEYNRTGIIATNNHGTVQNIRVKDATVKVGIYAEDDQEAHNVGALFGVNNSSGYVDNVYLSGRIDVIVDNYTDLIPEVNIGGLAGQNLGTMIHIEQLVDNREDLPNPPTPVRISVTNLLRSSLGAYYIGGLVGNNTGKLSEVSIPTTPTSSNNQAVAITVDSSVSFGVISDIGGIAGKAESSQGNEISACLIGSGIVTAGETDKYQTIDAYSYTGGLVGVLSERTHVFNCTAFCSVIGSATRSGISQAVGGVFGNIKVIQQNGATSYPPGTMMSIAVFGDRLEGANPGCFVGEAPAGKTWADYETLVDVKKFPDIEYIGTYTAALTQP